MFISSCRNADKISVCHMSTKNVMICQCCISGSLLSVATLIGEVCDEGTWSWCEPEGCFKFQMKLKKQTSCPEKHPCLATFFFLSSSSIAGSRKFTVQQVQRHQIRSWGTHAVIHCSRIHSPPFFSNSITLLRKQNEVEAFLRGGWWLRWSSHWHHLHHHRLHCRFWLAT